MSLYLTKQPYQKVYLVALVELSIISPDLQQMDEHHVMKTIRTVLALF